MSACKEVTVKKIIPLYRDGVEAERIELVELEEVGYTIVSGKDLYQVGDKGLLIEPDYCLSDIPLFADYIRPDGDPKKSKLGSNFRIKAIKFNFHVGDNKPVYSYGILMNMNTVKDYIRTIKACYNKNGLDYDRTLNIIKWEPYTEAKNAILGGGSAAFPSGFYKTDETNINNVWNRISYPVRLVGTQKIDGSSITIFCMKSQGKWKSGICSRNFLKELTYLKHDGFRQRTFKDKFLDIFRGLNNNRYAIYKEVESESEFVKVGKPYLDELTAFCKENDVEIALRGELNGIGLKGSGNKNNPSTKEVPNIKFFGADHISSGFTEKMGEEEFDTLITGLGFTRCKKYFERNFRCKGDILKLCNTIFEKEKSEGKLIEGIVIKTPDSSWSAKLMNLEYDSKK